MTIRRKTLLIMGATIIGLLLVIYWVCATILTANLNVVEEQATRENVARVRDALIQRIERIDTTTSSWAQWDDTCRFLRDKNRAYYETNLTPDTITTMKSNIVVLINSKAQVIFGTNHDLKEVKNSPLDPQLSALIKPDCPLLYHASNRSRHIGFIQTTPFPLLVVTRPIVNNNGTGPVQGTLLTGVYLSQAEVKELSQVTHLGVEIWQANTTVLPSEAATARAQLPTRDSVWINPLDDNTVAGYRMLNDIFGQPALLLRVTSRRDIFRQGQLGIRNVIVGLLISGVTFGLMNLILLERLVLSRVSRLSSEVQSISVASDFSRTVVVEGRDELSNLSRNINAMINALQSSLLQREAARQTIEASLREKETLLKEVYHRVKNNLQIVSSLLNMQSNSITEPETRALFDESRNRIHSMALVHEKLYQSSDLGHINFSEYLENLSRTLIRSYNNKASQITLQFHAEPVQLDLDLAVPCGLIVNELVTNSLKYAFPEERTGTIFIGLEKVDDNELWLYVADDGIGIPTNFDVDNAPSIGMQLVIGLTQQLEGHYELIREHGTRWNIRFKPTEHIAAEPISE